MEGSVYISVYEPREGPEQQLGTFPAISDARIAIIRDKRYISGSKWQDSEDLLVTAMPDGSRFTITKAADEFVINVSEQSWDYDVVQRSHTVPVIVYWWAIWSTGQYLEPVLERLAAEAGGRWDPGRLVPARSHDTSQR